MFVQMRTSKSRWLNQSVLSPAHSCRPLLLKRWFDQLTSWSHRSHRPDVMNVDQYTEHICFICFSICFSFVFHLFSSVSFCVRFDSFCKNCRARRARTFLGDSAAFASVASFSCGLMASTQHQRTNNVAETVTRRTLTEVLIKLRREGDVICSSL